MSLLDDLITAITALAGLTGVNGHTHSTSEKPGIVLVKTGVSNNQLEGLSSDEIVRPFELKLFAKDQTDQDTFFAFINSNPNFAACLSFTFCLLS